MRFILEIDDDLIQAALGEYAIDEVGAAHYVLDQRDWWSAGDEVEVISVYEPEEGEALDI